MVLCFSWFKDKWDLEAHIVARHPAEATDEMKAKHGKRTSAKKECPECGKLLSSQHMSLHWRTVHAEK